MARKPIKKRKPRKTNAQMAAPKPKIRIRSADRYEFDQNIIPPGQAYQWIAIDVTGQKQDISRAMADGWKLVPFKRHATVFADSNCGGRIIIDGLMLVENTSEFVNAALAGNTMDAEWADRQRLVGFFGSAGGMEIPPSFESLLPSGTFQGEWKKPHEEPFDVEVSITLRLTPRQLDVADYLNITPQEYGRRVAKMMPLMPMHPDYYGVPHLFKKED